VIHSDQQLQDEATAEVCAIRRELSRDGGQLQVGLITIANSLGIAAAIRFPAEFPTGECPVMTVKNQPRSQTAFLQRFAEIS
jgi:hypothetical protein